MATPPDKSLKEIHSDTKKIQKIATITRSIKNSQPHQRAKKYETHDKETRWLVIQSVMKALRLKITKKTFSPAIVLGRLSKTSWKDLNPILAKVLTKHIESFVKSSDSLKKWRRKFKEWIQSFNKPETRGGVLVLDEMLAEFKQRVISVLQSLPCRSFLLLRPRLVCILEDIQHRNSKKSTAFKKSTACSKHFWYEFLEKNLDIKEIYEKLPIVKTKKTKDLTNAKYCLAAVGTFEEECFETAYSSDLYSSEQENNAFEDSSPFQAKEPTIEEFKLFLGDSQGITEHDDKNCKKKIVKSKDDKQQKKLC